MADAGVNTLFLRFVWDPGCHGFESRHLSRHHPSTRPIRVSARVPAARLMYWGAAEAMDNVHVKAGCTAILRKSGNRVASLVGGMAVASRCRTSSAAIA